MTNFLEIAELDRIKPGASLVVEVLGNSVALFNAYPAKIVDGKIMAKVT
jgi:hypothetical protein